jgi:O-antigen/teichoic acid export membrane protein
LRKKFTINLVLLVFLNLLIKPFWIFGIDRTMQNVAGEGEYGLYFSLFSFSIILNILLDLGTTNFNNREVAKDPSRLPVLFPNMVVVRLVLGVVYVVLLFLVAKLMHYSERQMHLLLFLALNQFLATFVLYLRSNISGLQQYKTDSFLSVADRLLMIVLCGLLLFTQVLPWKISIETFVYMQTAAYLATAVLVFALVLVRQQGFTFVIDRKLMVQIVKQSLPFAGLIFLMSVYNRTDAVLLERMLCDGGKQAGVYAQAYRILDAANMFAYLFPSLLLPMFARLLASKADWLPLVRLSFSLLFVASVVFAFCCAASSQQLMSLLYTHADAQSAIVFRLLVLSFIPLSVITILGTLLTANGSMRSLMIAAALCVGCNLLLNLVLIPWIGAAGAAMASLATQLLGAGIHLYLFKKTFGLPVNKGFVLRCLSFLTLAAVWAYFVGSRGLQLIPALGITAVFVTILAVAFRLLPITRFVQILKRAEN